MAGLSGMLGVARDGLMAQAAALDTTGQNVANVNTPGYARRTAVLASRAQPGSAGGVDVVTFARDAAQLASRRVYAEAGKSGAADARAAALATLESLISPSAGGIADRMNAMFSSLTTLSADGGSAAARATVLARAADLAASFSATAASLTTERASQLDAARNVVRDANESLASIARYNGQIASAEAAGTPANDLRDARDVLVRDVATRTGAHVVEDERGQMTVFVAGTAVVTGNGARPLSADLDPQGMLRLQVHGEGGAPLDVTARVTEGTLGGLREARDVDATAALRELDQLAYDLATSVNATHAAGYGLDGVGGRNLFVQPGAVAGAAYSFAIDPAVAGAPNKLAASGSVVGLPGGSDVALALSRLATSALGGSSTPAERVASWIGGVGARSASARSEASLRASTVQTAESNFESQRGVSLDEEMVNLTRFQRAFEASTRILHVADELLGSLIREL